MKKGIISILIVLIGIFIYYYGGKNDFIFFIGTSLVLFGIELFRAKF